jgi:hypothetical protein
MTKKHFEIIARLLAEYRTVSNVDLSTADVIDNLAGDLAMVFRDLNPRFDTDRFIDATREV